jgi:diazepam-binding inhibitor (GABA receptor modulating acyl-CoA-binding protein)
MADTKAQFEQAQKDVKTLTRKPGMDEMAFLYSHYKQATEGDVKGERPGMLDMMGRGKYDSWAKLKGLSKDEAMKKYVDKVGGLLKTHK